MLRMMLAVRGLPPMANTLPHVPGDVVSEGNGLPASKSSDYFLEPRVEQWREIPSTGLHGKGLHLPVI